MIRYYSTVSAKSESNGCDIPVNVLGDSPATIDVVKRLAIASETVISQLRIWSFNGASPIKTVKRLRCCSVAYALPRTSFRVPTQSRRIYPVVNIETMVAKMVIPVTYSP